MATNKNKYHTKQWQTQLLRTKLNL